MGYEVIKDHIERHCSAYNRGHEQKIVISHVPMRYREKRDKETKIQDCTGFKTKRYKLNTKLGCLQSSL